MAFSWDLSVSLEEQFPMPRRAAGVFSRELDAGVWTVTDAAGWEVGCAFPLSFQTFTKYFHCCFSLTLPAFSVPRVSVFEVSFLLQK